jgi:uncharacterized membrane protein
MNDKNVTAVKPASWDDQRIEVILGALLRTGVILAAAVVLFGGALYLVRHGGEIPNYRTFHSEPESLKKPAEIIHGTLAMKAQATIQLGLLLLIATPVARVIFSAAAFAVERDSMYVVITLIVLAILLYGLLASS